MTASICKTCGIQYPPAPIPPKNCPICQDERQYVGYHGQEWTTLEALRSEFRTITDEHEPGLTSFRIEPHFAIGQRAFLLQTAEGNLLWDCISLFDDTALETIRIAGGLRAIAVSHPHYYTTMVEWSRAFGDAPIYLHEADRQWVVRTDANIRFWTGEQHELFGGVSLIHSGGHFNGYQVALWPDGAEGRGVLLAGDQPQVCADRRWVSFMYSYPNYIPLGPASLHQVVESLRPQAFDRLYGAFEHRTIDKDAKAAVERSAERFLRSLHAT